jgi:thioredoxin reductase (NADPH)
MTGSVHPHALRAPGRIGPRSGEHEAERAADARTISRAVIVAVDEDAERVAMLERALTRRFGADYDVLAEQAPQDALAGMTLLRDRGAEVALVLADAWMPSMDCTTFLAEAGELHPEARRAVLVEWGELERARESIIRGAALGQLEGFLAKPWRDGDEEFYLAVGEYLTEWDREHRPQFEAIRIIGDPWDGYVQALRDALFRSGVDHGFYDSTSERGGRLLVEAQTEGPLPVVILFDGRVMARPSAAEIASALGVNADPGAQVFDVTVIGAGPGGLAAAVYGASEGLDVLVVDQEALGGQASTSSLIRNYLGFPRGLSGAQLAIRAYGQAWFFGSRFLIGRTATALRADGDERVVSFEDGSEARSHAVILAAGVSYRRLGIERLEALVGRGVFYGSPVTEPPGLVGQHVVVVGGGNSSGQASIHLSRYADSVTLVVRGSELDEMSEYLIQEIKARPNIALRLNTVLVDAIGDRRLKAIRLREHVTGAEEEVATGAAFIMIGALPRTDWLPPEIERDERGYVLTGEALSSAHVSGSRHPAALETSMPGVFAVGDVRAGSIKRVAGAVGEGSTAIRMVHEYLHERAGAGTAH